MQNKNKKERENLIIMNCTVFELSSDNPRVAINLANSFLLKKEMENKRIKKGVLFRTTVLFSLLRNKGIFQSKYHVNIRS